MDHRTAGKTGKIPFMSKGLGTMSKPEDSGVCVYCLQAQCNERYDGSQSGK
jgi:hypothetical protein